MILAFITHDLKEYNSTPGSSQNLEEHQLKRNWDRSTIQEYQQHRDNHCKGQLKMLH